jgi:hypothetical protein
VPVADLNKSFGLDTWVYRGADWYVPDPEGSHVARETATVRFKPKVMKSLDGLTSDVAKLVGVSDDLDAVARASEAAHDKFGDHVTASRSQPYYLDVTHRDGQRQPRGAACRPPRHHRRHGRGFRERGRPVHPRRRLNLCG